MRISRNDWNNFIKRLSDLNQQSARLIEEYINTYGTDDPDQIVNYSYKVIRTFSNGSAALNAAMYDVIAELSGVSVDPAELADLPEYGDVAKAVYGTMKTSLNASEIASAGARLVKRTGADTMLQNARRDGAQFAWIPAGDTCAFCLTLASRGWQYMSKAAMKDGHAEHIHSNCDCTYAIRFNDRTEVAGYDPAVYREMYEEADGIKPKDKINSMRRMFYADNREEILEQKASAEEKRKELNSSEAEETNVD